MLTNAMTDSSYRIAAAVLAAWQQNARSVLQWAHPSWLASTLGIDESAAITLTRAILERGDAGATSPCSSLSNCSLSLLRSLGFSLPELHEVANPGVMRVDALPPASGLRLLRIRALRFRRGEIRRIVDRRMRASIVHLAGLSLDRLIAESPNKRRGTPDIEQMSVRVSIPPVTLLDGNALALEGHALIMRDLGYARSPLPLLRLALPVDTDDLNGSSSTLNGANGNPNAQRHWVEKIPGDIDQHGTEALFAELPNLFPEYAWLSG